MEGFDNIEEAQVHSVATSAMDLIAANIHENVEGFDEAA